MQKNEIIISGKVGFPEVNKKGSAELLTFQLSQAIKDKKSDGFRYRNFPIKKWNPEFVPQKDDKVEVQGYLEMDEWEDKQTKTKKSRAVIMALRIDLYRDTPPPVQDAEIVNNEVNDDLPF